MLALWLRFLTEIDEQVTEVDPELLADKDINQALELVEISAFDEGQLEAYERFWDGVRVEKAIRDGSEKKVLQAEEKGRAEGIAQGKAQGAQSEKFNTAKRMKAKGFDIQTIADLTQLPLSEIEKL